jgi:hypothetical protein
MARPDLRATSCDALHVHPARDFYYRCSCRIYVVLRERESDLHGGRGEPDGRVPRCACRRDPGHRREKYVERVSLVSDASCSSLWFHQLSWKPSGGTRRARLLGRRSLNSLYTPSLPVTSSCQDLRARLPSPEVCKAAVSPSESDAHAHVLGWGYKMQLPLDGSDSVAGASRSTAWMAVLGLYRGSWSEVIRRVKQYIMDRPDVLHDKSRWIEGMGWSVSYSTVCLHSIHRSVHPLRSGTRQSGRVSSSQPQYVRLHLTQPSYSEDLCRKILKPTPFFVADQSR